MIALVRLYADLFPDSDADLGCTYEVQHISKTGDPAFNKQSPHRIPYRERANLDGELHKPGDPDLIQATNSPWASPLCW